MGELIHLQYFFTIWETYENAIDVIKTGFISFLMISSIVREFSLSAYVPNGFLEHTWKKKQYATYGFVTSTKIKLYQIYDNDNLRIHTTIQAHPVNIAVLAK